MLYAFGLVLKQRLIYKINRNRYTEIIINEEEISVFDMLKVGKNIADLRKQAGMTQMGLADQLGISYQAVSSWERGESMPDVSKLPQLAEIFNVSIDAILEKSKSTQIVVNVLENTTEQFLNQNELSVAEISEIAPILLAEQVDGVFEHVKHPVSIQDLLSIAPFISEEVLDECAKIAFEREGINALLSIAPFISDEVLDECAKEAFEQEGIKALVSIAPFISDEMLDECARSAFEREGINALLSIAPFISDEMLDECAKGAFEQEGIKALVSIAPYISDEVMDTLAKASLSI